MGKIMKDKPILFSTPMVQALLVGQKTQTRRIKKSEICPYGKIGDLLWVRETFCQDARFSTTYKADNAENDFILKNELLCKKLPWKPSIFMPRSASRITLEITDIKVERLQDITRGDCMAEGCPFPNIQHGANPITWYRDLWNSINGAGSWLSNPYVWVLEFKPHLTNIDKYKSNQKPYCQPRQNGL
jgi:hypothetical protein